MPTMAYGELFGIVLCVHGTLDPSDDDWDKFVELCQKNLNGRCLVWHDQGQPKPAQRSRLTKATENGPIRTAVCSDAAIARGVVTAFSWFNKSIAAFPKKDLILALKFLEVPAGGADSILAQVKKMRASLSA